jgi:hypothetical protein
VRAVPFPPNEKEKLSAGELAEQELEVVTSPALMVNERWELLFVRLVALKLPDRSHLKPPVGKAVPAFAVR